MDLSDFVLARLAEDEQRFDAEELPYFDEAERRGVTDHDIRHMSAMTVTKTRATVVVALAGGRLVAETSSASSVAS
jgi:hypothetical protein